MTRLLLAFALLGSHQTLAFDTQAANGLVKRYAETVACSINPEAFKAVKVSGEPNSSQMGDEYAVYWEGDMGCAGGRGSVGAQLTIVRKNGLEEPVVDPFKKASDLNLVCADQISVKDGVIILSGTTYGANDRQSQPKKPVEVSLKVGFDDIKVVAVNTKPAIPALGSCVNNVR